MFTGIVETVGTVVTLEEKGDLLRLSVKAPEIASQVRLGDSVAVGGACLTIAAPDPTCLHFEAMRESLDRTNLGELHSGSRVNLERAMRADARLDGHIVQGHVDEAGRVRELRRRGDDVQLLVETSKEFSELLVEKGSVAIDGVSLTVVGVEAGGFDVALIPHTLQVTTLGQLEAGARVNLEADVLGKYVKRYLERIVPEVARGEAV